MAMRVLAHRLKSAPFGPTITTNWWVNRRTTMTWQPRTFFIPVYWEKMRGERFLSPEDAVEAFKNHVLEMSQSEWKNKHKSWSHIKTFWVRLCLKILSFPMEVSDCSWQDQKYARPEIYADTHVPLWFFQRIFAAVCCGVRGRALASHTDVRGFKPLCGGRLPSLICWQLWGSIYMSWNPSIPLWLV